ncbi:MAG TPA: GNAT family protein [Flavobacterium sp.]|nr:GNAT family protein [Flavobacterium sp.]HPJ09921.1 GNAT family protein [Flavobacterium sp.]
MLTLTGKNIYLRALEPEDLEFVYAVENDETVWHVSNTQTPYSRFLIKQYLENAQQDIYEARQLRLAICKHGAFSAMGLVDLFEYDPRNRRAGVGILIKDAADRSQGFGAEALELLIKYAFSHLSLHQLFANIATDNEASLALFANFGFEQIGIKKQWNLVKGQYKDEAIFQRINNF